jgi:flagellin
MGLRINQNIAAQNAYRSLSVSDNQMSKSLEKLSSGFRINRAADDAAGLAISEGLRSQVGGLKTAARNAQDGVSVVQTAEGALTEVHSVLQRMRDLSVQAANDSNNAAARANIATEVTSLTGELTRISGSTNFNGIKLLDGTAGTAGAMRFQVGADGNSDSQITVNLTSANVSNIAAALGSGGATFLIPDDPANPGTADATLVTGAMSFNNGTTGVTVTLGAAGSYATIGDVSDALNSDSNFANTFSASVNQAGTGLVVTSKTGGVVDGGVLGTAAGTAGPGTGISAGTQNPAGLSFLTAASSQAAIGTIDQQITAVSSARADLGSLQNRFEHAINSVNVSVENLSASESRIRDTDMAQEMMSFTRSQILSQAGTAMLAQANQSQQGVLSLLRG